MAAPVKPESTPGTAGSGGTPVPSAAELASRATPPTNPQPGQRTETGASVGGGAAAPAGEPSREEKLIAAQEAALRDMYQQNARLTQQLRDYDGRIKKIENPEPSAEDLNEQFWKNPVGVMNQLIQTELKRTVEPMNAAIRETRHETAYDRAKKQLAAEYKDIWQFIEPTIDDYVRSAANSGTEINEQLLGVAALSASGAYYRGMLPTRPGNPSPTPAPVTREEPAARPTQPAGEPVATPPHLRPSAPTIPGQDGGQQKKEYRALTENEKRLARERGMSHEQFLDWMDVKPEDVVRHAHDRRTTK